MKIVHFISSLAAGGAEIYVKDLSIYMAKMGHDIKIFYLDRAQDTGRSQDFEAKFKKELLDNGIEAIHCPLRLSFNVLFNAHSFYKKINDLNPDLVHFHLKIPLIYGVLIRNYRILYTHHNIRFKLPKMLFKYFDTFVSEYVGISDLCAQALQERTRKNVIRIDNGVDSRKFRGSDLPKEGSILKLVSVGSLIEQKNHEFLVDVICKIKDRDIILQIAGEGPFRTEIENKIKREDLCKKVKLLGNVSDMASLYSSSDIFVMSSRWEGLPISQIEAAMSGLPMIVTNVGGCAEVVNRLKNGVVIDELSVEKFAEGLIYLIDDEHYRKSCIENARVNSKVFDIRHSVSSHIKLYSSVEEV